ncbi:SDR family oxidoreductase [Sphingomonas sp. YL-JM2C]
MSGIALIIGGGSGIGAASARSLAAEGHHVAVADLREAAARDVAGALPGGTGRSYVADAADERSLVDLFAAVEREMGDIRVLVVAAGTPGYIDGARPTIRGMPVDAWDAVMALNARGPMICIREMLRRREARPVADARIVLIGSMAAQTLAINSPASYVASKGAMMALARVAAGEAAALGVSVNVVAPGAIDTPMLRGVMPKERDEAYFGATIAGRAGSADEIAAAVAFLASTKSSYINGACIDVNGGLLMR